MGSKKKSSNTRIKKTKKTVSRPNTGIKTESERLLEFQLKELQKAYKEKEKEIKTKEKGVNTRIRAAKREENKLREIAEKKAKRYLKYGLEQRKIRKELERDHNILSKRAKKGWETRRGKKIELIWNDFLSNQKDILKKFDEKHKALKFVDENIELEDSDLIKDIIVELSAIPGKQPNHQEIKRFAIKHKMHEYQAWNIWRSKYDEELGFEEVG